ncbi:MAG TPA: alginate lyase family protein [Candidatus Krumholzibacteria bacterium]|nr:alginate lyase family protein [Candidatus Krumholzibacteria bacterium]
MAAVRSRLLPARRAPAGAERAFAALLAEHARSTPSMLWDHAPVLAPDRIHQIRSGRSEVLGRTVAVGPDTDWHVDPLFGVRWPARYVGSLSDRCPGSDLVLLWHLNKTAFLVDHAEAFLTTGDAAFARDAYALMDSWCRANPWMIGMNWRSPMEAGTRLVVWSQTLAGLRDAPPPPEESAARIVRSLLRHADFVAGHFSEWPVPNNHLIGEAATLFAFYAYWPELADGAARMQHAERIVINEAERQVLKDGFTFECSVNYHLYALDWFLVYLHAKVLLGETPPDPVVHAVSAMARAAMALPSPSGRWPAIGDDSIEEFFAIHPAGMRARAGAFAFADLLKPAYAGLFATAPWARELLDIRIPLVRATHLAEAGITVARDDDAHIVFVHGPQHRRLFANGHMHADAATFELELHGEPLIVDSGTYLYTRDAAERRHFRGARAHNAPIVDGLETMEGPAAFRWESVAIADYLGSGTVRELTGIGSRRKLAGGDGALLEHTRALVRAGETVLVVDTIRPRSGAAVPGMTHTVEIHLHTPTPPGSARVEGNRVRLADGSRFVRVMDVFSDQPTHVALAVPADPMSSYSTRYGERHEGITVTIAAEFEAACTVVTAIRPPDVGVTVTEMSPQRVVCSIDTGHQHRVVRVQVDPFLIAAGGYALAGRDPAALASPDPHGVVRSDPADLAWLDEIA